MVGSDDACADYVLFGMPEARKCNEPRALTTAGSSDLHWPNGCSVLQISIDFASRCLWGSGV